MAVLRILRSNLALLVVLLSTVTTLPTQPPSTTFQSYEDSALENILGIPSPSTSKKIDHTLADRNNGHTESSDYGTGELQEFFDSILLPRQQVIRDDVNNTLRNLQRRQCDWSTEKLDWICDDNIPTMSEIVAWLREKPGGKATRNRHGAFYVNLHDVDPALRKGGDQDAAKLVGWLDKNGFKDKYFWWGNASNKHWLDKQVEHLKENRDKIEKAHPEWEKPDQIFLRGLFQGMAFAVQQPVVFFFTRDGKDWDKNTIWQEIEYPTLTRNKNVQQIVRVDPTCLDNKPVVMWDRKKRDPLPPIVFRYPDMR